MKYLRYLLLATIAIVIFSFAPGKKQRKVKPAQKAPFGHVQSVREVTYHAIEDSSGNITKGTIISDTDYDARMNEVKLAISDLPAERQTRAIQGQPIEMWTYDEYGDEIEDAKCHATGKLANRVVHIYYETGDVKEIIDSTFPRRNNDLLSVHFQQYTYAYDSSGKHVLVTNNWDYYLRNKDNPAFKRTVNIYDSANHQVRVLTFTSDTINPSSIIYKVYDKKGKMVESDERRRQGNPPQLMPFEKNDFWYDDKGRLYDKATYHPREGLVKDEKITFDSTGKTTVIYSYTANKVLTGSVEKRVFDASGTTQEDTYDGDGMLTDYFIAHDSAKHLIDKGMFHITYKSEMGADRRYHNSGPGDTVMVHHIINDGHFNTVVDDHFSNNGKPISQNTFQYTYDITGNWISKVQFNNDKAVKITEREIVYFNN